MGKRVLKEFIQSVQNRISIAVTLAMVKLKPEHLTGEEFGEKIQGLVFDDWVKSSDISVFENKIIELQRNKLFEEINDLLLPPGEKDGEHSNTLNDSFPGVCSEQYLSDELLCDSDTDSDNNEIFAENISFIEAIIQLKFSVECCKPIARDSFYTFRNMISKNKKGNGSNIGNMMRCSEDYGEKNTETVDSLTSSIFRFVTHSSKTDHLIKKCMTSIINFSCKSVLINTIETYNLWQGSVMEYLCSILREVSFHPVCSDSLLNFILKILDDIWSSEDINKHFIWEHQEYILLEFCVNSDLCESAIDYVFAKFNILADAINEIQIGRPEHLNNIYLLEKLPHFIQFLTRVIQKFRLYKVADAQYNNKNVTSSSFKSVKDFWKLKWEFANENESAECTKKNFEDLLNKWKDICEKLMTTSATKFPIISVYIWDIMLVLQGWIVEVSD